MSFRRSQAILEELQIKKRWVLVGRAERAEQTAVHAVRTLRVITTADTGHYTFVWAQNAGPQE